MLHEVIAKQKPSSEKDKSNLLQDLKEINRASPYHYIDYYIALFYFRIYSGKENRNKTVTWLEKASNAGNSLAMCALGEGYSCGRIPFTQSHIKANQLLTCAANKGNAVACHLLGHAYRKGTGNLVINHKSCVELWKQSASQGYILAQHDLAAMYLAGSPSIPRDRHLHFSWSLAAAEQGHGNALLINITSNSQMQIAVKCMDEVGICYMKKACAKKGLKWFARAAAKGQKRSQYSLIKMNT